MSNPQLVLEISLVELLKEWKKIIDFALWR
jgi:hypothetical protein